MRGRSRSAILVMNGPISPVSPGPQRGKRPWRGARDMGVCRPMIIYPAIDIKGGRCVRLTQGRADAETVYAEDPAAVAAEFKAAGSAWVHVVDLDGAFAGEPRNLEVVARISRSGSGCSWAGA